MATYVQGGRSMTVTTPLGPDVLLLVGLNGHEGISQLFSFQLDLIAENKTDVPFDQILARRCTVNLVMPGDKKRFFSGICRRISQGERDATFTHYQMEIVPEFWLLSKRAQSRIFQHISVPDILKKVLDGLDVAYELQGKFEPRDYCVQYRETDFNFASRLMEEEGIYYFFKHAADGHKMVVANTAQSHSPLPEESRLLYEDIESGNREEGRVFGWQKSQELRSGKYRLWDHSFELPGKNLEATSGAVDSVPVGKVTHKLKVGGNDKLEVYDFPGEYAQRFDGVEAGGGDRPADLPKIFEDSRRTVGIRMEEETTPGIVVQGGSSCRNLTSGHRFTLERHFNADGAYVLTGVQHAGKLGGDYRSSGGGEFHYANTFTCIPLATPYRPLRLTPKPVVQGSQTATVVGPGSEEIFTDKYGRVKVQFHWDREGKKDQNSSCWIRVAQNWAGKRWGIMFIPRIGQEVVVDFLEGDPDQPIITGRVYNADEMPPYELPKEKTKSTIKSNSSKGGGGFNEVRFEDKSGSEQIFIHAEKDMDTRVKNDSKEWIGNDRDLIIKGTQKEHIDGDRHLAVGGSRNESVGQDHYLKTGMKIVIESGLELTLKSSGGFIKIDPAGITIMGTMVLINSGGAPGVIPQPPAEAAEADDAKPGAVDTRP